MSWKLATFNVNGIRARLPLVLDWLGRVQPDALCLQEAKAQEKDFPFAAFEQAGYQCAYNGQKSFNGVALICRSQPQEVQRGLADGREEEPEQARFIAAKVDGLWVVNTYVPQGQEVGAPAFAYKLEFFSRLHDFMKGRFSPEDRLLWAGDINVAPEDRDVFDPKRMQGKVTCHPDERRALAGLKDWGLEDVYRLHSREETDFTFWDYRLPKSFQRNLGWRIDMIHATAPLAGACVKAWVDKQARGLAKPSDHAPLVAEFDL